MMACDQGKQNLNMGGYGKKFLDFWLRKLAGGGGYIGSNFEGGTSKEIV